MRLDIKAILEGEHKERFFSGMRATIRIKEDYYTTSVIEFDESLISERAKEVSVRFISPENYAKSLWIGKKMEVFEGSKRIGYITVSKIINPILMHVD